MDHIVLMPEGVAGDAALEVQPVKLPGQCLRFAERRRVELLELGESPLPEGATLLPEGLGIIVPLVVVVENAAASCRGRELRHIDGVLGIQILPKFAGGRGRRYCGFRLALLRVAVR